MSSKMMKMAYKIGIIGGTFDPVHYGHLILAEQACDGAKLDRAVFIPTKQSPFKMDSKAAPEKHRYAMVETAIFDNPRFSISDIEMKGPDISYTIDTLQACRLTYGTGARICFICGIDSFLCMESWKHAESIFKEFTIIVGSRPRYKDRARDILIRKLNNLYGTRIEKIHMPKIDISSTDIKKRIRDGRSIKYLLPADVEKYIDRYGLYR